MNKYFSLNTKYDDLYHSLLFYFTIIIIHFSSNYLIWTNKPTKKQIIQISIVTLSILFFHLMISPSVQVNVYNDKYNNDHIMK